MLLLVGNSLELAQVVYWKDDIDGALVGTVHKQPALDSLVYEAHLLDCHSKQVAANVITQALYAQ